MNDELQSMVESGEMSVAQYRLEEQVARISALRGSGRTHRACEHVKQLIAKHGDGCTVVWYIPVYTWTRHIIPMLRDVMGDFARIKDDHTNRYLIEGAWGSARLFFYTPNSLTDLSGVRDVHFAYDEGESFDYEYLEWLRQRTAKQPRPRRYNQW